MTNNITVLLYAPDHAKRKVTTLSVYYLRTSVIITKSPEFLMIVKRELSDKLNLFYRSKRELVLHAQKVHNPDRKRTIQVSSWEMPHGSSLFSGIEITPILKHHQSYVNSRVKRLVRNYPRLSNQLSTICSNSNRLFQCNICAAMFYTEQLCLAHQRRVHEQRRDFPCSFCHKKFQVLKQNAAGHSESASSKKGFNHRLV